MNKQEKAWPVSWWILSHSWCNMKPNPRHSITLQDTTLRYDHFLAHWISKTDLFLRNIFIHVMLNILILQLCLAGKYVLLGSSLQSISKNIFQMMGEKASTDSWQAVKFKEGYCSTVLQAYSQLLCIFISQSTGPQVPCYGKECLQNFSVKKKSNVWIMEVWRNIWK